MKKISESVMRDIIARETAVAEAGVDGLMHGIEDFLEDTYYTVQGYKFKNNGDSWLLIITLEGGGLYRVAYSSGSHPLACVGSLMQRWGEGGVTLKPDKFATERAKQRKLDDNTKNG